MQRINEICASWHAQQRDEVLQALGALSAHEGEHRMRSDAREETQLWTSLIDWFVRQSIGHDAAIKAYFDNGAGRFTQCARPAGGIRSQPNGNVAASGGEEWTKKTPLTH